MTELTIIPSQKTKDISPILYGIFFEDINYAGDGGLYAELIANRSFEYYDKEGAADLRDMCWRAEGGCDFSIRTRFPLSTEHSNYARLSGSAGTGIANLGFCGEGFAVKTGQDFRFSCYARNAAPMSLLVRFTDSDGKIYSEKKVPLVRAGHGWTKYTCTLTATDTCSRVYAHFLLGRDGTADLDLLSLFPTDTYLERPNGMRKDIAEMLAALSPRFMRFPGGCIVEGRSFENMYNWKETVGDLSRRRTNWNRWQMPEYQIAGRSSEDYFQSYGLGFFEYFRFCEDIGAKPVPVINAGMTCQWHEGLLVDMEHLDRWIQDALDLIEFANGGTDSEWGRKRAEMGHPEPFHLEYLGIGNEQWGEVYFERYEAFQRALSERHPEIRLITCAGWTSDGADFDTAYSWMRANREKAYAVDEHFYKSPEWFLKNINRYDNYDRTLPKVFAGEYAAHSAADTAERVNDWHTALCEAAFLTGIEQNADHVAMACYAPLLARTGHNQWQPNLIWFDSTSVYGTPSYYVQKLFSNNVGTALVKTAVSKGALPDTLKTVSTLSQDGKHLYVKLVNLAGGPAEITLRLEDSPQTETPPQAGDSPQTGGSPQAGDSPQTEDSVPARTARLWEGLCQSCTCSVLAAELDAANSPKQPQNVFPNTETLTLVENTLPLTMAKYSVTVLDFAL